MREGVSKCVRESGGNLNDASELPPGGVREREREIRGHEPVERLKGGGGGGGKRQEVAFERSTPDPRQSCWIC